MRAALEPLQAAFGFEVAERAGGLAFRMTDYVPVLDVASWLTGDSSLRTRQLLDKAPQRLRLTCIDPGRDYEPMMAEARRGAGDPRLVTDVVLPLAMSQTRAEAVAAHLLALSARAESTEVTAGPGLAALEPGDLVRFADETVWRIDGAVDEGASRRFSLTEASTPPARLRFVEPGAAAPEAVVYADPDLVVMDAPFGTGLAGEGPLVAAFADPWPGAIDVLAGTAMDGLRVRAVLEQPAVIARLLASIEEAPAGRWQRGQALVVSAPVEAFASLSESAVLAGGNGALLETDAGWELIQFQTAELVAAQTWRLTGLLRGQGSSVSGAAGEGARLVLLGDAVQRAVVSALERSLELVWKADDGASEQIAVFEDQAALAWQPCHLRVVDGQAHWLRRGPDVSDSWAYPEASNDGRFAVEFDFGSGFGGRIKVAEARCEVLPGTVALRVAGLGPDGRTGPWLSIGPGSPYL